MDDEFVRNPQPPSPHVIVECGPYSDPDVGCKAERDDSLAAYANALAWAINGTEAYARQAIRIMDAYSSTIQGHNNSNAPLQSGWVGSVWARAGEIIRYTNAGWSDDGIQQFGDMLRKVYMPLTVNGTAKNVANWELETSRIQGTDLYETDLGTRLRAALEFHSQFDNGKEPESWLCGGKLNLHLGNITEVGFNALSFRMGLDMPETENLTERQRPARQNGLFTAYETLTHAQNDA
ncbi:hypothetical protein APSETT445_002386 [Aspergillus pseudonomiae]